MGGMLWPTVLMGLVAVILLWVGYNRGAGEHMAGLKAGGTLTLQILPLLAFAMIIAGMIPQLISREAIQQWVGDESGWKGLLIATVAGGLTPGGPYVCLPLVGGLLRAGVGTGVMVAYVTAWSLWAVGRVPMEIGILGWKFTLIRLVCTFFFPPFAGWLAMRFFNKVSVI